MSTVKKRGLGRGLASLLSDIQPPKNQSVATAASSSSGLRVLGIDQLQRGKYQPRKTMHTDTLQELADSIKHAGIIQPIVVRMLDKERYEIVAGERRWRAAQLAGLQEVPVVVKEIDDHQASALALIENIQREDLNVFEEAQAMQRLLDEFQLTHEELAESVGKSRTTITNLLRVLNLNSDVQKLLSEGKIELGHAKVLLALTGVPQSRAAQVVVARGLSVRETENYVRNLANLGKGNQVVKKDNSSPEVRHLQQRLAETLGAKVKLDYNAKGQGKITINYNNLDELQGILAHFNL